MPQTVVASLATPVTLLTANAARHAVVIYNTDANALSILIAGSGTVSTTNLSYVIPANTGFTVPSNLARERITGIWALDGTGSALHHHRYLG
jgi:hypothetical protein